MDTIKIRKKYICDQPIPTVASCMDCGGTPWELCCRIGYLFVAIYKLDLCR